MDTTRTYTLNALVVSDTPDEALKVLLDRTTEALVEYKTTNLPHHQTGEAQTLYKLTLKSAVLRDTHAHGMAFAAGFITWVS